MNEPLPLIIKNNENKLQLNEELLKIIKKSTNPEFFLFYGKTRLGKSTTLNQLIRGNNITWKFKNKKPFDASDTLDSITKGCNIYGPIKASELLKRHNINKKIEDFDIFFCDTEGISSLDGIQKETIPGILTLLQICTLSVFMVQKHCDVNILNEICSQIQISRCLKQINDKNKKKEKGKEFPTPRIAVYISNIFINSENNEEEDIDLKGMQLKYNASSEEEKERIYDTIKQKYSNLNIKTTDFDVIPGGPYNNIYKEKEEPNHEDINNQLYWWSINELMAKFIYIKRKK